MYIADKRFTVSPEVREKIAKEYQEFKEYRKNKQMLKELRFLDKHSIIKAAKEHGKMGSFGSIARDPASRGVTSAYGIGFLDGAEWAKEEFEKIIKK